MHAQETLFLCERAGWFGTEVENVWQVIDVGAESLQVSTCRACSQQFLGRGNSAAATTHLTERCGIRKRGRLHGEQQH